MIRGHKENLRLNALWPHDLFFLFSNNAATFLEVLVFVGHWTDIEIWFILYNCNIERKSIYIFSLRIFHWVVYNLRFVPKWFCSLWFIFVVVFVVVLFCIMCTVYVKGIKASWRSIILSKGFIVNKMYLKFLNLW